MKWHVRMYIKKRNKWDCRTYWSRTTLFT